MDSSSTAILTAFLAIAQPTFANDKSGYYLAVGEVCTNFYQESYSYNNYTNTNSSSDVWNLKKAYDRINHLSKLEYNWDGRGALPISDSVLLNIKKVLKLSYDCDWENWLIGPDVNATIRLQSKKNKASISLGATEYSYFARLNGQRLGESHIEFKPEFFVSLMRKLDI